MRVVIQRCSRAKVTVNSEVTGQIGLGLLILVGIEASDTDDDLQWLAAKIVNLRIFEDSEGLMNLSVMDVGGEVLAVSQFTLHAKTKKGNRPSFIGAAPPEVAKPLFDKFVRQIQTLMGKPVGTGIFGAKMDVELVNNGPVTIIIDTKNKE
ncbi:MAG TPA: D-aminoacyl-tRNA deacylase [Salinivirgaceae bacterium]|nr:D-aminoacyl-tRNA deacylase [Salinivirgaceae bacterium]